MQDQSLADNGIQITAAQPAAHPVRTFLLSLGGMTLLLLLMMAAYPGWHPGLRLGLALLFVVILVSAVLGKGAILCRCILPLLIGGICVEAYILVHEMGFAPDVMKYFIFGEHYNEIFYSGIATLYAIITALALVKGIEDFDAMKRNIADEAYRVRAISEMTHYFDHAQAPKTHQAARALKRKLLVYARNVAAMNDKHVRDANLALLRECQADIITLVPEDENDRIALHSIMEAHNHLGTLRSKRINAVGEKIPHYLIWALWLMAASLVLPFMAEPLMTVIPPATEAVPNDARFGQYSIIFLLGALNSFLLLMLSDISDPFEGFWKVNMEPFNELSDALAEELAEERHALPVQAG